MQPRPLLVLLGMRRSLRETGIHHWFTSLPTQPCLPRAPKGMRQPLVKTWVKSFFSHMF